MQSLVKKQEGQSVIIIMLAMITLVALLALVVDTGNAYVQRRMIQNAIDSGAQAGALAYAQGLNSGQVYGEITQFVQGNGVPTNSKFYAYYVLQDTQGNLVVNNTGCTVNTCTGPNNPPPTTMTWNGQNLPVVGVQVQGTDSFNTFFAGVVGWRTMQESAGAAATCFKGAATGKNLFPIAVSNGTFVDTHGNIVLITEQDDPTHTYTLYESGTTTKNIGFLRWSNSQATDSSTLATNMSNTNSGVSGPWAVNNQIPGSAGSLSSSAVQTSLNSFFSGGGQQVTMPVYGVVTGTQGSAIYQVVGFARFRLVSANYNPSSGSKYITVKLEDWVDPAAEGGATNYGIVSCKLRPALPPPTRELEGNVKIDKVIPSKVAPGYVPVDVVEVLDTSGSMKCDFTGQNSSGSACVHSSPQGSQKITSAISALTSFSSNLQPTKGDRAALVTFPDSQNVSYYPEACDSSHSYNQTFFANPLSNFTNNITGTGGITNKISGLSATGGTPTGSALKQALAYLTGPNHTSGNAGVVVLATDGIADVTLSQNKDQWTGSNSNTDTCNDPAVQDAVDQANQLKAMRNDGSGRPIANVFVVAVGADFNQNAVAKIATKDTGSTQHVFQATDAGSMTNIYNQISAQTGDQQHDCPPSYDYPFAPNVNLTIKNTTTGQVYPNVMTDSGGHYSVPNVQAGTFQIVNAIVTIDGYTYNVFENQNGGDVISSPTTDVGLGSGVYPLDVFLQTSTTITCAP